MSLFLFPNKLSCKLTVYLCILISSGCAFSYDSLNSGLVSPHNDVFTTSTQHTFATSKTNALHNIALPLLDPSCSDPTHHLPSLTNIHPIQTPFLALPGEALCALLRAAGAAAMARELCSEVVTRAPSGTGWAWRQLGYLQLASGEFDAAVASFQMGLRAEPSHAGAWEALGSGYQSLGRFTAALKVGWESC